ncbi:FecR family protein [Maribacter orientalis]|uniref:FecR family protein n=1 Tax=Maribacter orientalis TaxID=228957 RepID=A0A1H7UGI8_9FLAO|nr:FecR family protein [Maribacter orientalis]SEL95768.1 FecR family protein [Maribacter orientalis]
MNNSNKFDLQYFLTDSSFKNWAKGLNKNDIDYWNNWLQNNPQHIETVENAKSIVVGIKFKPQFPNNEKVDQELSKILPKIGLKNSTKNPFTKIQSLNKAIYFSAAAVVLILLSWTSLSLLNVHNTTTHQTNFGEIIDLKLPDGTSVVLNGNSEISYEKDNPRFINLKGEAYFRVKSIPSTNAKFWVITNDLKVEVLGTQFHVNTREQKTNVVLDEGSIHLEFKNGDVTKMIPGEMVSFSNKSNELIHKKVTVETPYALWRGGTYSFNEIPLKEVMFNLELTYGLEVRYSSNHLKDIPISGGIPNQNLKICIAAIEKATGTRIINKGNILQVQENPIY